MFVRIASIRVIRVPKRIVQGFDRNRIQILTAIAEKKMYMNLSMKDLFVNINTKNITYGIILK